MNLENGQDVVLVDAYNLIYRAFHGNQNKLTNEQGIPTNAIFTVARMLLKLPKSFSNLTFAAAVFDGGGGTNFRKELDEEYKANRKDMPEDLKIQMPYIKRAFELLGWPILQAPDVEADDVLGTMALRSSLKGYNTYIISGDKDFRQIVNDNLHVIDTMHDVCYDKEAVKEKMGVYPENVAAWLALVGDDSDNVKGVDKVGKGTAPKLLEQYGSLQGIIDHQNEIKGKIGENIREAIANGQLQKSLDLVTLKTDVEIEFTRKTITPKGINIPEWNLFCEELGMKSLKIFDKKITP